MASLESIGGKLFVNGEEIALKKDLETKTQIVDFGTVSKDTRTVLPNPFFDGVNDAEIATRCIVRAEIQVGGIWSETGWYTDSSQAKGTSAASNHDGIVVQTAINNLAAADANYSGGGLPSPIGVVTSAPCRVIVSYQGELVLAPSLIPKPEYIDKDQLATAWVNFDASDGSIRSSFNVSSITGTGSTATVNFATAMDNLNYVGVVTINGNVSSSTFYVVGEKKTTPRTLNGITYSFNYQQSGATGTSTPDIVNVIFYGGKS